MRGGLSGTLGARLLFERLGAGLALIEGIRGCPFVRIAFVLADRYERELLKLRYRGTFTFTPAS